MATNNDNNNNLNEQSLLTGYIYYTLINDVSLDQISNLCDGGWSYIQIYDNRVTPTYYYTYIELYSLSGYVDCHSYYSTIPNVLHFKLNDTELNSHRSTIKRTINVEAKNCNVINSSNLQYTIHNFNNFGSQVNIVDKYEYSDNRKFSIEYTYNNLSDPTEDLFVIRETSAQERIFFSIYSEPIYTNKRNYNFKKLTDKGYTIDSLSIGYWNNHDHDYTGKLSNSYYSYTVGNNGEVNLAILKYNDNDKFEAYIEFGSPYPTVSEIPTGTTCEYKITTYYMNAEPVELIWNPNIYDSNINP